MGWAATRGARPHWGCDEADGTASPLRTARGSPLRQPQRRRPAPVAVKSAAAPTLCPSGLHLPLQDGFLQVPVKDTWPSWGHGGDAGQVCRQNRPSRTQPAPLPPSPRPSPPA